MNKERDWTVYIAYKGWDIITVKAKTEEEALEQARNAPPDYEHISDQLEHEPHNDTAETFQERFDPYRPINGRAREALR